MMVMLGQVPGVDQKIVYVRDDKPVEELKEIRHDPIFIVAWGGNECRLPLVAVPDTIEVISAPQVKLQEDAGPTEFLEGSRDQGKRVREPDSVIIEGPVVDAWPQVSFLLTHEEEAWGHWRGGSTNELLLESLLDVIVHRLALRDRQGYTRPLEIIAPGSRSQSHGWCGGNFMAACLLNTSWNAV